MAASVDSIGRFGQEGGDAGERLVGLGIEDVQDSADEKRVTGLLPVVPLFERPFGIDQDVGDVLNVANLPFSAADLEQRIVGGRLRVGRVEEQHPAVPCAEAGGELPVLTFDIVNDGGARPGQQRRHHEADALAGTGRGEAEHMLGSVVAEIGAIELAEHDTVGSKQPSGFHLIGPGPARGAVGLDVLGLASSPHRHAYRDRDRDEAAGCGDVGALDEDRRRVGIV